MPGNVPNISSDTFNLIKEYAKVVLQQGVPILDSDWNELQDVLRMQSIKQNIVTFGNSRMAPGASSDVPGFRVTGDGSDNNFIITGGLACVEGVLVPSQHGVTEPGDIYYDSEDNYILNGAVTAVGGGTITDENVFYELFLNVVGCRIRMTSGAEIGNTFTVTVRNSATQLTLDGGTGSIAPGDTYLLLPPALTTPGTVRVDEVYIQAWFDDINAEEDTALLNPALGLEPSHRSKLRSCVRVAEGGATPVTPDPYSFGVRHMKIGYIERNVSATILPWYCFTDGASTVKLGLGGADLYSAYPLLLWRNMGRQADSEVDQNTFSLYQWQAKLILLKGGYLTDDGHVWVGTVANYPVWFDTEGFIKYGSDNTPGADLGQAYLDDATWDSETQFSSTGPIFKGGSEIAVHNKLTIKENANLLLEDNSYVQGDSAVISGIPMKMFGVDTGYYLQMHYTDREIWWTINTNYNRTTEEFVSITPATSSFLVRFVYGSLQVMEHAYSLTPWTISEWSPNVEASPTYLATPEIRYTSDAPLYALDEFKDFPRKPGLLCVHLPHPVDGSRVGIYRTDDDAAAFDLISGSSSYFSNTAGNPGTVNVWPNVAGYFSIQNKLPYIVNIGYSYLNLYDVR